MAPSDEVSALPTAHMAPSPPRNIRNGLPAKRASFAIESQTSAINTPVTPRSLDDSSSSAVSLVFDVRASFAPLTFTKPAFVEAAAKGQGNVASRGLSERNADTLRANNDDRRDIYFAGRKWKGKTAHAVEQEMEKFGDHSIMSHAPDAVYLASRLQGLQRNIEVGGDDARGRRWTDYPGDTEGDQEFGKQTVVSPCQPVPAEDTDSATLGHIDVLATSAATMPDDCIPAVLPPHITDLLPPPSSKSPAEMPLPRLDPAAKAAALDSRVEIRLLRRSDLEQVHDLHCLYGDSDKVDTEHYVTSAAFLLRLLFDESYVCVVAVAKPLPEPEAPLTIPYQAPSVPECPPPSMDIPASSAAYFFTGNGITSHSPLLKPLGQPAPPADSMRVGRKTRFSAAPPSSLGRVSPILGAMPEEDEDASSLEESDIASQDDDSSPRSSSASLSPRDSRGATSLFSTSSRDAPAYARASEATGSTSMSGSSSVACSGLVPNRDCMTILASHHDILLVGPTNEVAPPRALRVMVPPAPGASPEMETVLGVASASVHIRPATESLWGDADEEATKPRKEIHLLTLAVARAERGLGLGGRLLESVMEEANRRNIGTAYRAQMGRRYTAASIGSTFGPTRTYLEVHSESSHALGLYTKRGFSISDRLRGYFRGDARIPTEVRSMPGGSDALLLERFADVAAAQA